MGALDYNGVQPRPPNPSVTTIWNSPLMPAAPPLLPERRRQRVGVSVARALQSTTRAGIFDHLREEGDPETVRDIAGLFDLHPNVARTHLELLADAGLVEVGRRKHPGGGRPAKVYTARQDAALAAEPAAAVAPAPAAELLVLLLAALVEERPLPVLGGRRPSLAARAHEAAATEGRRLVTELADRAAVEAAAPEGVTALELAATVALTVLRPHAPDAHVTAAGADWLDVVGVRGMFGLLESVKPSLAEALERGLLAGALTAAGVPVSLADAGGSERALRARALPVAPSREAPAPAGRIDARGEEREAGVVRAMRAVTGMRPGEVLEVLAEGPGSPAAFARWADRAGHDLLGVERATDDGGRPAIRLLIRKGA